MKRFVIIALVVCPWLLLGCAGAKATRSDFGRSINGSSVVYGCRIQDNQVVFEFRPEYYTLVKMPGGVHGCLPYIDIAEVCVAGEFNSWSTNDWPMTSDTNGCFVLRRNAADFTGRENWHFTFVVNKTFWVEPPGDAANVGTDLNGADNNLVLRIPPSNAPDSQRRCTAGNSRVYSDGVACFIVGILLSAPWIVGLCL